MITGMFFPQPIEKNINDFLWGTREYQLHHQNTKKLCREIEMQEFIQYPLTPIFSQKRCGETFHDIEDDLFCDMCGEKQLFPFTRSICWECSEWHTRHQ